MPTRKKGRNIRKDEDSGSERLVRSAGDGPENLAGCQGYDRGAAESALTARYITNLNPLKHQLLGTGCLTKKLKLLTDGLVEIMGADFARIWITKDADLCEKGCSHAAIAEGLDVCRDRTRCLHLTASSGRYTHIVGKHRRVPLGSYKIGRIATGENARFITNDVANDPQVHDHEWAKSLGLVAFAGCRLLSADNSPIGVLAFFRKSAILPVEEEILEDFANTTSQVILSGIVEERNLQFASLVASSNDSIIGKHLDGTITSWNRGAEKLYGYTASEAIGCSAAMLIPPERRHELPRMLERVSNGEHIDYCETVRLRKDGRRIQISHTISPIRNMEGGIVGVSTIARDITDHKKTEAALRESEERYRVMAEQTGQMIYDDLLDSGTIRWAGSIREVTGDEPSEFENSTVAAWEERIHPEDRRRAMDLRLEMMKTGGRYNQEYRFRRKDGSYIFVEDHGVFLRNEQGKIYRVLGTVADISERARAAQEREQLVGELQKALTEVRTLSGLLPICANCKKIRDDRGNWTHIEEFIQERSDAQFSHGICPECTKKLYSDLA